MYIKLKEKRIEKNLTIYDMANLLNITPAYYYLLENGKRKLYYELGYNKDKYLKMKNISLVKKLKKDGFNDSEIETFQNELKKVKKISR